MAVPAQDQRPAAKPLLFHPTRASGRSPASPNSPAVGKRMTYGSSAGDRNTIGHQAWARGLRIMGGRIAERAADIRGRFDGAHGALYLLDRRPGSGRADLFPLS